MFSLIISNSCTATAKSLQSCQTLCDSRDGSPPGSLVLGILQARTLEWVAISFSNAWKWKEKVKSVSRVWLFATPWTAVYQAPPPMGFSRQEDWSGVPSPSPTVVTTRQNKIWSVFYHPGKLPHAAFQSIFNCLSHQSNDFLISIIMYQCSMFLYLSEKT